MRKPFSERSLKMRLVTGKAIVLWAWWLSAQGGCAWNAMQAQSLPPSSLHGHVFHGSTQQPLPDALIMAWPCGLARSANALGAFDASCPNGLDSLTVHAQGYKAQTVLVKGMTHIDVWLQPLEVMVSAATVAVVQAPEQEAQALELEAWTTSLDKTPGMQGLDLGAAMVQPVMRGLVGSRVTVMEDGVPLQGARWGTDHGILADWRDAPIVDGHRSYEHVTMFNDAFFILPFVFGIVVFWKMSEGRNYDLFLTQKTTFTKDMHRCAPLTGIRHTYNEVAKISNT